METKEVLEKSMKERMVFGNGQEYLKSHALMDNGEYRELKKPEKKPVEEKVTETKSTKEVVGDLLKACGSKKDKAKWGKAKKEAKKGYPEKKQEARWPIVQKIYQQMKGKKGKKGKSTKKSLKEMVADFEKGVR